ncbi:pyridoxal phosphate-dependent transferase [Colletotrichum godetiae]|uniref:Pyridoxal phosphate-dependent transferase n=1 Tax=Colletotrichum godetiae TaxID=1209918 RepID=A0AAJ0EVW4_9PEZI|nr:pyridoxal phosphate-dependent transferase [Colletotrichum godetiae]KAK1688090.1 pyridoxal phosphate-dependent transferase [Colletotrichum godetiae]
MSSGKRVIEPSSRALANLESGGFIDLENEAGKLPQYDPVTCPDGVIDLSGAINGLMDDVLAEEMDQFSKTYDFAKATRYGDVMGPKELAKAMSSFINRYFGSSRPVTSNDILVTNGVTSLLDMMAFGMCDPGEGIMVITPTYMMFPHDLCARAGVSLIRVNTEPIESQFDEQSAPLLINAMSRAHAAALKDGIVPKAILLCNPSNPCGRTYPRTTLVNIARFCGQKDMHLLSDEIYAMSTFTTAAGTYGQVLPSFTSVLSIQDDPPLGVFAENIHCMYGASKDFGCGGLRLGFLVTRNELLWRSLRRLVLFTWVSSFSTAFFTHFLLDEEAVRRYLKTYRQRLETQYKLTAQLLTEKRIPFVPANSGVFIFVKLTDWLDHGEDLTKLAGSREMRLCRHLLHEAGVFLSPGELSLSTVPGCFRLVYTDKREAMPKAIKRLATALEEIKQRPRSQSSWSVMSGLKVQGTMNVEEDMTKVSQRTSIARLLLCRRA